METTPASSKNEYLEFVKTINSIKENLMRNRLTDILKYGVLILTLLACFTGCGCLFPQTRATVADVSTQKSTQSIHPFPCPVPRASARYVITSSIKDVLKKSNGNSFKDIDSLLVNAFKKCGYYETGYYAVPRGFALVSRMERIYENANSFPDSVRWINDNKPIIKFTLRDLIRLLFTANPGYYRTIVFIVTDTPCLEKETALSKDDVSDWLYSGGKSLPHEIGRLPMSDSTEVISYIYEFSKERSDTVASQTLPSMHQGRTHLEHAGLLTFLEGDL